MGNSGICFYGWWDCYGRNWSLGTEEHEYCELG